MSHGFRRLLACIGLGVLAILLPEIARAETSMPGLATAWSEADPPMVTVGPETEILAGRILALARAEDPATDERKQQATPHPAIRPQDGFQAGTWRLGAMGGYSIPHNLPARDRGAPNVHFAPLLLQAGYTVTDVHGPTPIRGSLEVIFEPTFLITATPKRVFGEGVSLLARYNFVTGTRWVPFFDLGIGLLHWNLELRDPRVLGTRFNFTLHGGPGLHYFATDHLAITGQMRFHHISNAGRARPNIGVNSSVFLLGFSYFF